MLCCAFCPFVTLPFLVMPSDSVPAYLTEKGTGYLQQGFAMECIDEKCAFEITRDTLALRKLANDLAKQVTGKKASELLAQVP
jgi:hypothetical protein